MKQVVQSMSSGETKLVDVPAPQPGPGMVLVRTTASLVSPGTERAVAEFAGKNVLGKAQARPDLVREVLNKLRRDGPLVTWQAVQHRLQQPQPLGYSSAGVVERLGEGVSNLSPGQRVACAGGGYAVHAEFASVPQMLLSPVPDGVSDEEAAFATLGSVALHALRLAEAAIGERVAVIGLGLLGQLALRLVEAAGGRAYGVDVDDGRVRLARKAGFAASTRDEVEAEVDAWTDGQGFDAVLICAETEDSDPVELAGAIARDRACVVAVGAVGMQLPRRSYYAKELTFKVSRSYGPGRYDPLYEEKGIDYPAGQVRWTEGRNLGAFLELVASDKLDLTPLITHRFPIERALAAYSLIKGPQRGESLAIVLEYPGSAGKATTVTPTRRQGQPQPGAVGVGVIGAGNYARSTFLPTARGVRGVNWVGLASERGLSSAENARRFDFAYAASDAKQLFDDPAVTAVAILTRHNLHASLLVEALAAGKHVFCEKPLALTQDELERAAEAMRGSDRWVTVGFNRRFAPLMVGMRDFMRGAGGPLLMQYRVNAGALPAGHWLNDPETGGGRIVGEACHFIDAMTFLCGAAPRAVHSQLSPGAPGSSIEDVVLTLRFGDGSVGSLLYSSRGDKSQGKERLEAFGGGRSAVMDDFRQLEMYVDGRRQVQRAWLGSDKGHQGLWRAFVEAVRDGGPAPIAYEDLFAVTAATFAALASLQSDQPEAVNTPNPPG